MRKFLFLIGLFSVLSLPAAAGDSGDMERLKRFFTHVAAYHNTYPQEKVYLHLDNNGYFPGDKIWFKAYVLGAASLLPTDLSKVLYVELLTPDGDVLERQTLPVLNGRTYGALTLSNLFRTGFYEVRAYTRAMLNWDAAYAYSRVVPVFDLPADSTSFNQLTLYNPERDNDREFKRKNAAPLLPSGVEHHRQATVAFFPVGGHIVKGLENRVAFKLYDKAGAPADGKVAVYADDGRQLTDAQTMHEGMGVFSLPKDFSGGYVKVVQGGKENVSFRLPAVTREGATIDIGRDGEGAMLLTVKATPEWQGRLLGVSVTCRGQACYFDTLKVGTSAVRKQIPRRQLRDGVEQVTLFSPDGEVLAERLAWVAPVGKPMVLDVAQNASWYGAFSPVVLNFTLQNGEGKGEQGEFSLSVQDVEGMVADDGTSLQTDMLLCSDLKGYVHQPEYYFEADDAVHREALDLLLLVQGWRRYEWKEMAGVKPFVLRQPAEDRQMIDGRVVDRSKNKNPKSNIDVNLMLIRDRSYVGGTARTDTAGNFALALEKPLYDNCYGYFTTTIKDKRQRLNVVLNRNFSPSPRTYEPQELKLEAPGTLRRQASTHEADTFVWVDTLPKVHHLPEAKVVEKLHMFNYGSRYTFMGGEGSGKKYATIYYNLEDELQEVLDNGDDEPYLFDWLAKKNPNLDYQPTPDLEMKYKGRPVVILVDNALPRIDYTYLMSEFRSLVISEDEATLRRFYPADRYAEMESKMGGRQPVTFLLYSNVNSGLLDTNKKGTRVTVIHGFSRVEDFYSPDYRTVDAPSPADIRRTLYWNPAVLTDENGRANVILFSNFRNKERIHINAQGISATGRLFGTGGR